MPNLAFILNELDERVEHICDEPCHNKWHEDSAKFPQKEIDDDAECEPEEDSYESVECDFFFGH